MSWQIKAFIGASLFAVFAFTAAYVAHMRGSLREAEKARVEAVEAMKQAQEEARSKEATVKVVEKIVYKWKVAKGKENAIKEQVVKYVPSDSCTTLDAEWVRLHNEAAQVP